MRVLYVFHKDVQYEFRLLEASKVIQITKGDTFCYEMRRKGRLFICSCPGSTYHGKCWHRSMIKPLLSQPQILEPWAIWAEEAEVWQTKLMKS